MCDVITIGNIVSKTTCLNHVYIMNLIPDSRDVNETLRPETETFDFGSEAETEVETFRTETDTFFETIHTSEL